MTNAEAIETLRANYPDACFEQLREAVDVAIEALKAPATVDAIEELRRRCEQFQYMPPPAWIPVSERLPEPYSGEYLVTINDGSVYTDILWFDSPGDGRYESCFYKTDDDGYGVVCDDVIAWMPLPQPYKGERADNEHSD